MDFKLKAPFKPAGSQPEAIKQLVKGIKDKKHFQTLLGVTGSGKSVTWDSEVLIKRDGVIQFDSIGKIIDYLFEEFNSFVKILNRVEILDINDLPRKYFFETYSFNPKTNIASWKEVRQLTRHESPKNLFEVSTQCGRNIVVTGDHNFHVLRNGQLKLIETKNIVESDFLPLPRKIPDVDNALARIDIGDFLDKKQLFISAKELCLEFEKKVGKKVLVKVLSNYYSVPSQKWYDITQGKHDGLTLKVIEHLAKQCSCASDKNKMLKVVLGSQIHKHSLPMMLDMTDEFLQLLGFYIAEGHSEPEHRFFTITAADVSVKTQILHLFKHFKLKSRITGIDMHASSKIHSTLLANLCGKNAYNKKLPDFWTMLSNKQLAMLLQCYFEGDAGAFKHRGVVLTTTSKVLASQIAYALFRFGIWSRTYSAHSKKEFGGRKYWQVVISGKSNLVKYSEHIGFISKIKIISLNATLNAQNFDMKNLIPLDGMKLRILRLKYGLSLVHFSKLCSLKQGTVGNIERKSCLPRRSTYDAILRGLKSIPSISLEEVTYFDTISNLNWSQVKRVSKISSKGQYVYDFSVCENETFLAGFGGLFVHNTFTCAHVIKEVKKPTLVLAPNKTLAAQLYNELKSFFPDNRVEYFVSYYDYYQPESYVPSKDLFIEKDSAINPEIERMRLASTASLLSRNDTIVVASVSCIYGLGNPEYYEDLGFEVKKRQPLARKELLKHLIEMLYERNDIELLSGRFRVKGDVVDVVPGYMKNIIRFEFFGDEVERISELDKVRGNVLQTFDYFFLFPARHYVIPESEVSRAVGQMQDELEVQLKNLELVEAHRLKQRTEYDIEMIRETGTCKGIENYSAIFDKRKTGEKPFCLLDYFEKKCKNFLLIIDESHQMIPQTHGMYKGDRARKQNLVDYGFRLPSALDNRPLMFEEFEQYMKRNTTIFVSATPAKYEIEMSGNVVEQIIRPTGLIDPEVFVRPITGQVADLEKEIKAAITKSQRVLVTTLTKKLAEELTEYLATAGIKTRYLHSDIDTIERTEILRQLRLGTFDVLVGINLLREGIDIPEVGLVTILDADKEGFLRNTRSLIQIIGRAARNSEAKVVMYADKMTDSIKAAMGETARRREMQMAHNKKHGITPTTVSKKIPEKEVDVKDVGHIPKADIPKLIEGLSKEMDEASDRLDFEEAIRLRDQVKKLEGKLK
jgi:excinuclease ABC B subunit